MSMTTADLKDLGYAVQDGKAIRIAAPPRAETVTESSPRKAAAPASPYRSKWEAERADWWDAHKRGGTIRDWRHEGLRLKLADGAWYKPDFMVVHNDGSIELEEVKGHAREAWRVRWKVAIALYPMFAFTLTTKRAGRWTIIEARDVLITAEAR